MAQNRIKILILTANPEGTARLGLDREVRAIDRALRDGAYRDRFELVQHWAVRVDDLLGLLLRHRPHIVHFSGHGSRQGAIVLEATRGRAGPNRDLELGGEPEHSGGPGHVPPRALSRIFKTLKDNVRCVVLNACYTDTQARGIAEHIDVVVGMSRAVSDEAAIRFASAFYLGLGYGRDIQTAFELGRDNIDLGELEEKDTPQLLALRTEPHGLIVLPPPAEGDGSLHGDRPSRSHPAHVLSDALAGALPEVGWNAGGLAVGAVGLVCAVVLAFLASLFVQELPPLLRNAVAFAAVMAVVAFVIGSAALAREDRYLLQRLSQWLGRSSLAKSVVLTLTLATAALFGTVALPKIHCEWGVTCANIYVQPFINLEGAKRIIDQKLAVVSRTGVAGPSIELFGVGQEVLTDEMLRAVNRVVRGGFVASVVEAHVEQANGRLLSLPVHVPARGVESHAAWLELYTELTAKLLAELGVDVDTDLRAAFAAIPTTDLEAWDHKLRGDALVAVGQLEEAAAQFEQAISLDAMFADAHHGLGMVRERQGDWQEAAASYERAIDVLPGYEVFVFDLGNLLRQNAPPDGVNDAIDLLEGVIERDPTFIAARVALGETYLDLGHPDGAREVLEDGLRWAPESAPLHNGLGLVEIQSGHPSDAVARFETASRYDPTYVPAHLNHAEALAGLGDRPSAAEVLRRAADALPGEAIFPFRLGELYAERAPQDAVAPLEEALRLEPAFVGARQALGQVLVDLGRPEAARFHVEEGLRHAPDYAPLHNVLGLIELAAGEPHRALERFELATELDAGYGEALGNRADVLYELGDLQQARMFQERADQVFATPIDPRDRFEYDLPNLTQRCWTPPCP